MMSIDPRNIEQDFTLSNIMIDLYKCPIIQNSLALIGDTAIQKLYFDPQNRYTADLEFVHLERGSIQIVLDHIKENLNWLPKPTSKVNDTKASLSYKLGDEDDEAATSKIKIIIYPHHCHYFQYDLTTEKKYQQISVTTYPLEQLLAAKMFALYQRKKGRDLMDLYYALQQLNPERVNIIQAFERLQQNIGTAITRASFEENLSKKITNRSFLKDVYESTPNELSTDSEALDAMKYIHNALITALPGEAWEGDLKVALSNLGNLD